MLENVCVLCEILWLPEVVRIIDTGKGIGSHPGLLLSGIPSRAIKGIY